MANLRDIRKRIASVKSTQKITKAMKMVAASKFKRAHDRILAFRHYTKSYNEIMAHVYDESYSHPLLEKRGKKLNIVVITSDRGLCGGFNNNLIRSTEAFAKEKSGDYQEMKLICVGKRGYDYFKKREIEVADNKSIDSFKSVSDYKTYLKNIIDKFLEKEVDEVVLIYNEFKSAMAGNVRIKTILPVTIDIEKKEETVDYIFDQDEAQVFDSLVTNLININFIAAILDSIASEHGARMTAMDLASNNATEMIAKLTLQYNRARQAAITKELMEIITGKEALKG